MFWALYSASSPIESSQNLDYSEGVGRCSLTAEFHEHVPSRDRKFWLDMLRSRGAQIEQQSEHVFRVECPANLETRQVRRIARMLFLRPLQRLCRVTETTSPLETKFAHLHESIARSDAEAVQDAIFDLGASNSGWVIPDEVVERLLTLLRCEEMHKSSLAGHVLNFFEFQSPHLSQRQKGLCVGFLAAHGDQFDDVHSRQVVTELRHGNYLQMTKDKRK